MLPVLIYALSQISIILHSIDRMYMHHNFAIPSLISNVLGVSNLLC